MSALGPEAAMAPSQGRDTNTLSVWPNCSNWNADTNARHKTAFGSKGPIT